MIGSLLVLPVPIIRTSTHTGSCYDECRKGPDKDTWAKTPCRKDCDSKQSSCRAECDLATRCYLEEEKKFLTEEERFLKDNCTICGCIDRKVHCITKTCKLNCVPGRFHPVCEEESQAEREGCQRKIEDCKGFDELKCLNTIIKLGECCMTCPDKD